MEEGLSSINRRRTLRECRLAQVPPCRRRGRVDGFFNFKCNTQYTITLP
jgi:hypothetical protein